MTMIQAFAEHGSHLSRRDNRGGYVGAWGDDALAHLHSGDGGAGGSVGGGRRVVEDLRREDGRIR